MRCGLWWITVSNPPCFSRVLTVRKAIILASIIFWLRAEPADPCPLKHKGLLGISITLTAYCYRDRWEVTNLCAAKTSHVHCGRSPNNTNVRLISDLEYACTPYCHRFFFGETHFLFPAIRFGWSTNTITYSNGVGIYSTYYLGTWFRSVLPRSSEVLPWSWNELATSLRVDYLISRL